MSDRPLGVTIIGILWIIGGLLLLLGGGGLALGFGALFGAMGVAFGAFFAIIGLLELLLGVGCFMAWPWVWTVGVIITAINLLSAIYAVITTGWGALISLIISLIILYYLFQPHVKAYFGKA